MSEEEKLKKKQRREKFRQMFAKNRNMKRAFEGKEKEYKAKRFSYYFKRIALIVGCLILLLLLSNRTFFKENYQTSKIGIKIPMLMFFAKDDGNEIVLKTLRKTKYVQQYFDSRLMNMTRYNCDGYSFFYDDAKQTAIYNITVEKNFVVKTVKITYAQGNADCLCEAKVTGKEAEKICSNY